MKAKNEQCRKILLSEYGGPSTGVSRYKGGSFGAIEVASDIINIVLMLEILNYYFIYKYIKHNFKIQERRNGYCQRLGNLE